MHVQLLSKPTNMFSNYIPVSGEVPKPHKAAMSEALSPVALFRTSKVAEAPTSATFSVVNKNSRYGTSLSEYVLPSAFCKTQSRK